MRRWLYAGAVEAVLSLFTFLLLTGRYANDGPVLLRLSDAHGLHYGDVVVIAGWSAATLALVLLARAGEAAPRRVPRR